MKTSNTNHRQTWITSYRVTAVALLIALVAMLGVLLTHPAPTAAEVAVAVNGPAKFQRPSAMEYVAKTDSCVVGGTVMSTQWHVGLEAFAVGAVNSKEVDYTSFRFKSDTGREFTVSENGALYTDPGENLGLQLRCDPATMVTAKSFGLLDINSGGK